MSDVVEVAKIVVRHLATAMAAIQNDLDRIPSGPPTNGNGGSSAGKHANKGHDHGWVVKDESCPSCDSPLVKRYKKDGSGFFAGCSNFPDCKKIVNWEDDFEVINPNGSPADSDDDDDFEDEDIPF